ncbi:MAG: putative immunity protein [Pyrinomonadaceae bacterium]
MSKVKTISSDVLLSSELLSAEDSFSLSIELEHRIQLTASEILKLALPARNRVEALLQKEFLEEEHLRELACDFAERTLQVFECYCPSDPRPRKFVEIARHYYVGKASRKKLKTAFVETWRAIEGFTDRPYKGVFASGLAISLLYPDEADKMAQKVALWAQNAVQRREWENRSSDFELIIGREREAIWQLSRIIRMFDIEDKSAS